MPAVLAVLFDLDGVLIDSYDVWFHLLKQGTVDLGFPPITAEDFHRTWGQGVEADIDAFMPGTPMEVVQDYYGRHYAQHVQYVRQEAGALEVLEAVRNPGLPGRPPRPRGCVTNTPGTLARMVLARTGLLQSLEVVLGADEAGRSKPAPDGVLKLLDFFGVRAEEAVLVGDSVYDRDAAAAAGVSFVGLRMDVDQRIDRLDQLPAWLNGWEQRP